MCKVTLALVYCVSKLYLKNGRDFRKEWLQRGKKIWPEYNETVTIVTAPLLMRELSDGRSTFVFERRQDEKIWMDFFDFRV